MNVHFIVMFEELTMLILLSEMLQVQSVSLEQARSKNLHALERHKTNVQSLARKQPVRAHDPASR